MNDKYFLYIDILGFSDLVKSGFDKIDMLYDAIDKLNAHQHGDFKTIVFSDTILVFNKTEAVTEHDHKYLVMYSCEFAQDLQKWCIKLGIQFRAILLYGGFNYQRKEHIEAYYGDALIKAYYKEKEIAGMGLFISKNISHRNTIFKSVPFDKDLDFVFLTQNLDHLMLLSQGELPIPRELIEDAPSVPFLWLEVKMLKILKDKIDTIEDSRVRAKYILTYQLYKSRYSEFVEQLEKHNFDLKVINRDVNWDEVSADWWPI